MVQTGMVHAKNRNRVFILEYSGEGYKVDAIKSQTSNMLVQVIELFNNNIH